MNSRTRVKLGQISSPVWALGIVIEPERNPEQNSLIGDSSVHRDGLHARESFPAAVPGEACSPDWLGYVPVLDASSEGRHGSSHRKFLPS